jgi:hypothetical protein
VSATLSFVFLDATILVLSVVALMRLLGAFEPDPWERRDDGDDDGSGEDGDEDPLAPRRPPSSRPRRGIRRGSVRGRAEDPLHSGDGR